MAFWSAAQSTCQGRQTLCSATAVARPAMPAPEMATGTCSLLLAWTLTAPAGAQHELCLSQSSSSCINTSRAAHQACSAVGAGQNAVQPGSRHAFKHLVSSNMSCGITANKDNINSSFMPTCDLLLTCSHAWQACLHVNHPAMWQLQSWGYCQQLAAQLRSSPQLTAPTT